MLSIALPFGGQNWYWLAALSPLSGVYYWQRGTRQEDFRVRHINMPNFKVVCRLAVVCNIIKACNKPIFPLDKLETMTVPDKRISTPTHALPLRLDVAQQAAELCFQNSDAKSLAVAGQNGDFRR